MPSLTSRVLQPRCPTRRRPSARDGKSLGNSSVPYGRVGPTEGGFDSIINKAITGEVRKVLHSGPVARTNSCSGHHGRIRRNMLQPL